MLKKLIRHELDETWKIPALIFGVCAVLSLACAVYFYLAKLPAPDVELNVGNMTLYLLYAILLATVSLVITIYLGIRFYRNLYTDQGYLMHTLPVQPWMHIMAKTITGTIWSYLAGIFLLVTLFPVTIMAIPKMAYVDPAEMEEILSVFSAIFDKNAATLFFYLVPFMLASSISGVLLLYAAVCLGQLFGKHRAFSSILCYIGLSAFVSTVSSMFVMPGMTGTFITHAGDSEEQFLNIVMPAMLHTTFVMSFLANIVLAAAAFFLCNYLMKKCLNLD